MVILSTSSFWETVVSLEMVLLIDMDVQEYLRHCWGRREYRRGGVSWRRGLGMTFRWSWKRRKNILNQRRDITRRKGTEFTKAYIRFLYVYVKNLHFCSPLQNARSQELFSHIQKHLARTFRVLPNCQIHHNSFSHLWLQAYKEELLGIYIFFYH